MNKDRTEKQLKAVGYIRVGAVPQVDTDASQRQLEATKKWAVRFGITVVYKIDDSGKKPGVCRPFDDLLKSAKEVGASYIVCQDYSRLTRNTHDLTEFYNEAQRNGVQLWTAEGQRVQVQGM